MRIRSNNPKVTATPEDRAPTMSKDSIMAWGSFIGIFAWYHVVIYNFTNSPLRVLLEQGGAANTSTVLLLFLISTNATMLVSFLLIRDKDLHMNLTFRYITHGILLVSAALLPVTENAILTYILVVFCGGLSGFIFFRNLYSSCFHAAQGGWLRVLIASLFYFNILIHLFALVPNDWNPPVMYAISVAVLFISLVMSIVYHGNTLEVRSALPGNKLTWRSILPTMALFAGITFCLAAYKTIVRSVMPETLEIAKYQALICLIALVILFALGDRVGRAAYSILLLALMLGAFISFQVLGTEGHKFVESFIQPAYLCWNIVLFSNLRSFSHEYGKSHLRYRVIIILFLISVILPEIVAVWFFEKFLTEGFGPFAVMYAVIFVLVLLVTRPGYAPRTDGAKSSEDKVNVKLDTLLGETPLPDTDAAMARLRDILASAEHLTAREDDVLRLLLDGQDIDVLSYMLGISESTSRSHIKHICEKFGVHSRAELMNIAGAGDAPNRFSAREAEVLCLLAAGGSDTEISEKLYISTGTIRSHIHNLYIKCGVSSRRELIDYYNEVSGAKPTS